MNRLKLSNIEHWKMHKSCIVKYRVLTIDLDDFMFNISNNIALDSIIIINLRPKVRVDSLLQEPRPDYCSVGIEYEIVKKVSKLKKNKNARLTFQILIKR